jgi:hypothetical protein
MPTKTQKEQEADIADCIRDNPTWADHRVAAEVDAPRDLVTYVRAEMGPKDTWPKKKAKE